MEARYAFRVRVRLEPPRAGVDADPRIVDVRVTKAAPEPGTDGWLFFRDTLWRGEVGDEEYGRRLVEEWLDVPVDSVEFAAFHTDEEYFDALKAEIGANLELFNDDAVPAVVSKYLGSSVIVEDAD